MPCLTCRRTPRVLGQSLPLPSVKTRCDEKLCTAEDAGAQLLFFQLKTAIAAAGTKLQIAPPEGWAADPGTITPEDAQFALRIAQAAQHEPSGFQLDLIETATIEPTRVHAFLADNLNAAIKSFTAIARGVVRSTTPTSPGSKSSFASPLFLALSGGVLVVGVLAAFALRNG